MKKREGFAIKIAKECSERIKNNQCPTCGKLKKDWTRRTDWRCCSVECTEKFEKDKIIRSWSELRWKAFKRDNFTCVKCGLRPEKRIEVHNDYFLNEIKKDILFLKFKKKKIENSSLVGIATEIDDSSLIGDHIKPIALGGDEWDINNVQTLCINCNKIKTREDQKKIAKQRKLEKRKKIPKKQTKLEFK